jgi:hypothetical protein
MDNNEANRPKEEFTTARIRAACRDGFQSAIPRLIAVARGETEDASSGTSNRAIDYLGKYGLGRRPDLLLDRAEWLEVVLKVTKKHIPDQSQFQTWWSEVLAGMEEMR